VSWLSLHHRLERHTGLLIFGILLVSAIGGMVQLLPIVSEDTHGHGPPGSAPYSALELEGRDIYIRESCSTCHTQQIRPLLAEVKRYGPYSRAEEFAYDRPFPTFIASAGATAMSGTDCTCSIRAQSFRRRSCRRTPGLQRTQQTAAAAFRPACARWRDSVTPILKRRSRRRLRPLMARPNSMR
jgi:hypothetical protein